jgi:malate synthase
VPLLRCKPQPCIFYPETPDAMTLSSSQLDIRAALTPAFESVWTPAAKKFICDLTTRFGGRRKELLAARIGRQQQFDDGAMPTFLPETAAIRNGDWRVAAIPQDLEDRRVEITGPVDRKMIINAMNSGAKVFMADFEDSSAPTWAAMMEGQVNVRDAVNGTITYQSPEGKSYALNKATAVLMMRPRGWHLLEKHVWLDGEAVSASLVDFGLYFFHNVKGLRAKGTAPYFYLPKMESHLEARLWNDVFVYAQDVMGLAQGTIRATVLIETLPAAFEMDEFLYELRDHSAGLNCGRWDYIFNFIKCFRAWPEFVLPERGQVTMTTHFLRSYSRLLIQTCHRRGIHAMGGMAAQIPTKDASNELAMEKVRADKEREASDGHDGTWVGHPGLVPIATEIFNKYMSQPNQINPIRDVGPIGAADLIMVPEGTITLAGLRNNISVSLRYLEAWLRGQGCVPLYNLMEDAATAEIARTQIWQWLQYPKGVLDDGRKISVDMVRDLLDEEMYVVETQAGNQDHGRRFGEAARVLDRLMTAPHLVPFLTLEAYDYLP